MKPEEIGTFSDVLFYLERHGIEKNSARDIVMQVFGWGINAAVDRMRPTRPAPADTPNLELSQLALIADDAPAKATKSVRPAAPKQVSRTWPADFTLSDPLVQFATNRGFNQVEIQRMWERFRDRNQARGEKYADWNAAWRTWVNNQVEFKNRDKRSGEPTDGRL